jgi:hypothetical protein
MTAFPNADAFEKRSLAGGQGLYTSFKNVLL